MGKSTRKIIIFNSFLYVYQAGYDSHPDSKSIPGDPAAIFDLQRCDGDPYHDQNPSCLKETKHSYSYGHLLVTTGYKWDFTFYKWGYKYL